jgi:hypothetical protein
VEATLAPLTSGYQIKYGIRYWKNVKFLLRYFLGYKNTFGSDLI